MDSISETWKILKVNSQMMEKIPLLDKNDISTYYLHNWNVQPNRFENSIEEITRYSEAQNVNGSDYELIFPSAHNEDYRA
jgi:hypothetical protein